MDLKLLSNEELIKNLVCLRQKEREITARVLDYLGEVEARRLFALRGYGSLFEFCIKELRYSEGAAARRISAMRMVKQIPKAQESLKSGEVSLSTLSQLQRFVKAKEKIDKKALHNTNQTEASDRSNNVPEKQVIDNKCLSSKGAHCAKGNDQQIGDKPQINQAELFEEIKNKSQKQCEELFVKLAPESDDLHEKTRLVNEQTTEIKFYVDQKLMQKLEKLKQLLSHKNPQPSWQELIEMMADISLGKLDPEQKMTRSNNAAKSMTPKTIAQQRYIPSSLRQYVWMRDKGRCSYIDPKSGRKCESKHKLEFDHIRAIGIGGETNKENLRLLCHQHNALMAIKTFPIMSKNKTLNLF